MRRRESKTRWMNACANRTFIGIKQKFNASIIAQTISSQPPKENKVLPMNVSASITITGIQQVSIAG